MGKGKHDGIAFGERKFQTPKDSAVFVQLDAFSKKWKPMTSRKESSLVPLDIPITRTNEMNQVQPLEDVLVVVKQEEESVTSTKKVERKTSNLSGFIQKMISPRKKEEETSFTPKTTPMKKETHVEVSLTPLKKLKDLPTEVKDTSLPTVVLQQSSQVLSNVEYRESNIVDHVNLSRPKRKKRNKNVKKNDLPDLDE
jgi:hypothetical protein